MYIFNLFKKHLFSIFAATFILWGLSAHYWITTQTTNAADLPAMIYFLPEHKDALLEKQHEMITNAKHTIDVAAFGFTVDNPIVADLITACKHGIKVRLYRDKIQSGQAKSALANQQIRKACGKGSVKIKHSGILQHSKYFIVDNEQVLWGSYNYSASGLKQDNVIQVNQDGDIFGSNFNDMWFRKDNIVLK